jgi:hypothetical protein
MSAGSGAWSLEDGNYRIFEEFFNRSINTQVNLNTRVLSIDSVNEFDERNSLIQQYNIRTDKNDDGELFDIIVVASPLVRLTTMERSSRIQ